MVEPAAQVPFVAFRTALEPLSTWTGWAHLPAGLTWDEQLEELRGRLRLLLDRPGIREALTLASPDLDAAVPIWLREPASAKGRRVEHALVRYFSRLCGRPTPFGLFAGHSVGAIGASTRLALDGRESYRRHSRLDAEYLYALVRDLPRDSAIQAGITFLPNPSIYVIGGKLRFLATHQQKTGRQYHLMAAAATDYLMDTLEEARPGRTLAALAEPLMDSGATSEEAQSYLRELVERQLLVANLEPPITGQEPIHGLIQRLQHLPGAETAAQVLDQVRTDLECHDRMPLGSAPPYGALAEQLQGLGTPIERARLFQVDLFKPAPGACIGEDVLGPVREGVDLLRRLFGQEPPMDLAPFREAFLERFDQQEVPLLRLLDPDLGLPFGPSSTSQVDAGPLLAGLRFPESSPDGASSFRPFHRFLLNRMQEVAGPVLKLHRAELEPYFLPDPLPLPDAYSIPVRVEMDQGRVHRVFCGAVWGPTGACMLARFCHGDAELTRLVRDYLAAEEAFRGDAVFAEIVHLPEDRSGNVILRPLLRGHEIPLLACSGAPAERQIPLADLRVAVRDERFVLSSARLSREVVPRLTNAHHFQHRTLSLYRFLCSLQYQGVCSPCWDWGGLAELPFLPRIEVGQVVLTPASWRVQQREVAALAASVGPGRETALHTWMASRRLPRLVLLADGEHKLPVDLGNAMSLEMFLDAVRRAREFTLEECIGDPEALAVTGPEGPYAHELVVPFLGALRPGATPRPIPQAAQPGALRRTFPPGSEWLYVKLYMGVPGADELLLAVVDPWVREALGEGWADQWHFLRYGDPGWHLRVRLHGDPGALAALALPALRRRVEPYLHEHRLWKVQMDTYERELERYGPETAMTVSEALFHQDSEAALALVRLDPGQAGAGFRWQAALLSFDRFLGDFGLELEERCVFAERMHMAHLRELNLTDGWEAQLGERYRQERRGVETLLGPQGPNGHTLAWAGAVLAARSRGLAPVLARLRTATGPDLPPEVRHRRLWSYLHLSANRILKSDHRLHEVLFYDFLFRHYRSSSAKAARPPAPIRPGSR
jgi:thiopeptide-type bacteriocin biosynthesis protein